MNLELHDIVLERGSFRLELTTTLTEPLTGLVGPSGAGKTSLLELIAGLLRPAAGRLRFNGELLADSITDRFVPPWHRRIGYVPQDQALFPHMTVEKNLLYANRTTGSALDHSLRARVVEILELEPLRRRTVATLSGGEKGRVALGRALMSRPALLLLDEPLAHLDSRLRQRALDYLDSTASEFRVPMVFVSHSLDEIRRLCRRVIRIEHGRLVPDDPIPDPPAAR